jgi:predicted small secreted protein
MRLLPIAAIAVSLAACSNSQNPAGKDLSEAANQSDPAAAAVIEQAERNGANEQEALQAAGNAAAMNDAAAAQRAQTGPVQAVPNTVQTPNRPDGTRPPAKATGSTDIPGLQMGGEQKQPQPSGGQR